MASVTAKIAGPAANSPYSDRQYDSGSEGPARRTTIEGLAL